MVYEHTLPSVLKDKTLKFINNTRTAHVEGAAEKRAIMKIINSNTVLTEIKRLNYYRFSDYRNNNN
jgi:hypothetical protein